MDIIIKSILNVCLKLNRINEIAVFFEFSGHVDWIEIEIYKLPLFNCDTAVSGRNSIYRKRIARKNSDAQEMLEKAYSDLIEINKQYQQGKAA